MTKVLLYDNVSSVPQDIANLLGVSRYSDIYYRKRSLDRWISDICAEAGIQFVELNANRGSRDAVGELANYSAGELVVMYLPAFIAFGCPEETAALFLRKLSFTRSSLYVMQDDAMPSVDRLQVAVTVGGLAQSLLRAAAVGEPVAELLAGSFDQMHALKGDVSMIDMRDPLHFTDYLTSNFDVRFFNSVQTINDFVLIKRSSEVDKLRREHRYYSLLPPELQMFFIQPYDFQVDGRGASYKMERLFVPDTALQWIHGSLDRLSFERFLDKVFYYVMARPVRRVTDDVAKSVYLDAYRDKVRARCAQFEGQQEYVRIKPYIDANFGGVDALFERYFRLLERVGSRGVSRELRIGHGDLCFSNILYSKITGMMRFIDPRGADGEDDLYVSPYYDLAKLSHSIVGNYDFINYGLCELGIDTDLRVRLSVDPGSPPWARELFESRLRLHGFDPALIRLFEASLFLSMAPLHIDAPKKVLAFLVNADGILSELEPLL
ncbi:hypothetical protein [Azoarcus sp. KH32C]|uniref:hypothetical protein n=1 Tax=Azoarcus sp. KH32C TaxID=748247 RepID=UPI0002386DFE|nr:hypothetical protein [Azoarcus sp. KH32C]BAL26051.1 putative capsular polysaccharide biosynthesis protein [Azoarcus sp. KH32C]